MSVHTRSQRLAQSAYMQISKHEKNEKEYDEYVSFVKKFPALIHTCGLAQAIAFALAKKQSKYIEDLAMVMKGSGHPEINSAHILHEHSRSQPLSSYLRLSRDAISAAGWLKRYVEAAEEVK